MVTWYPFLDIEMGSSQEVVRKDGFLVSVSPPAR